MKSKSKAESNMAVSYLFAFLFIFMLNFVNAAPPVTTVQQFPEGYYISEQQYHVFKLGESVRYGFLLENASNGVVINDSVINYCRIVISNSQGFNTQSININYNDTYRLWGIELNETQVNEIFPEVGFYNYAVSCQDDFGAVITGVFEIISADTPPSLFIIILAYALAIFLLLYSHIVDYGDSMKFFSAIVFLILGLIFLLFDFGFNNETLKWAIVMINWGIALIVIFKNINYWLDGLG